MGKLTKPEKAKVGVAIALIIAIFACVAGGWELMRSGFPGIRITVPSNAGDGAGLWPWSGSWKTVKTWRGDALDGISAIEAEAASADIVVQRGTEDAVVVREQVGVRNGDDEPASTVGTELADGFLAVRQEGGDGWLPRRMVIEIPDALAASLKTMKLSTSSGDVGVDGVKAGALTLHSSVGDIDVRGVETDALEASSNTGDVTADVSGHLPRTMSLSANTGDIDCAVPRESGCTLTVSHPAGDFDHDGIDLLSDGGSSYRYGEGTSRVSLAAAVGDIELSVR